jgi:hypothetical protein
VASSCGLDVALLLIPRLSVSIVFLRGSSALADASCNSRTRSAVFGRNFRSSLPPPIRNCLTACLPTFADWPNRIAARDLSMRLFQLSRVRHCVNSGASCVSLSRGQVLHALLPDAGATIGFAEPSSTPHDRAIGRAHGQRRPSPAASESLRALS